MCRCIRHRCAMHAPAHGMYMFIAARCLHQHQLMAGLTNVDMLARIRMPLLLPVPGPCRRVHCFSTRIRNKTEMNSRSPKHQVGS